MAKRLIPLLDRVLVEKITAPNKSVGGILLPESASGKVRNSFAKMETSEDQLIELFTSTLAGARGHGNCCWQRQEKHQW